MSYHRGDVDGRNYTGGLFGRGGYITESYHVGNVRGSEFTGGLAGFQNGVTKNSYSEGNVVSNNNYVGGLVGQHNNTGSLLGILKSYVIGIVKGDSSYVGGLVGKAGGSIDSCYYLGEYVSGLDYVGGLAGFAVNVKNSFVTADSVNGRDNVGGFAGRANFTDSSYSTAKVKGGDNVGGLIGSSYGGVSNSYALGHVVGESEKSSAGNDNVGGLIGYLYKGSIIKSMALGDVSGTTKLGGLVGRFDGDSIFQSYANGNVMGDYYGNPADEVGNFYIGGLVGYAKGFVSESYASGIVKGMDKDPVYTGCLIGYVDGSLTIDNSYFDNEKCSLSIEGKMGAKNAGAIITNSSGKNTAEMQDEMTFANWDFIDTWSIFDETYPYFIYFANSFANADVTTESLKNIVYDGKEKIPAVTKVSIGKTTLIENTDYQVLYQNNIDAGRASIKVCGLGLYSGCKIVPFAIAPINLKISLGKIETQIYDTSEKTPIISIYEGETLLDDVSYNVEYSNNINVGTATVKVILMGNYSGSASKTFKIEKATPVVLQKPVASDIVLGETLSSSKLTGGKADTDGKFVWKSPSTKPTLENDGYAVVFVPTDSANFSKSTEIIVPLKVVDVVNVIVHAGRATLDSFVVVKGTGYTLPKAPDSVGYVFDGFYNGKKLVGKSGEKITINEDMVLEAAYQIKKFVVTFKNGTTTLQTSSVAYGTKPNYTGDTPTKTSTDKYSYMFKGWNPAITSVTESATYTAVFDSTLRKYTVTFKNGTTTLQTGDVAYGTKPSYTGNVPTKTSTDKYSYTFKGWSPTLTSVMGAATYTAVFDSTLRKYTITFKNGSTTLQTSDVAYGTKPSYTGSTPTKKATNKYTYKFKGWNPAIATVTKAATYQAVFDSTKVTGIVEGRLASLGLSMRAVSCSIQISAAPKNSTYAVLDMQGRVLLSGRVESANFNIAVPNAGSYLVRVGNATRKVQVK
jgi:hypothetical protein